MFGPTNIDEVYVQETYIEVGKPGVGVSKESYSKKDGKGKGNGKKENLVIVKEEKLSASIAIKKGMMMSIVGNFTQRKDLSGSKKGKGGKKL
jgi:hypothetical protein